MKTLQQNIQVHLIWKHVFQLGLDIKIHINTLNIPWYHNISKIDQIISRNLQLCYTFWVLCEVLIHHCNIRTINTFIWLQTQMYKSGKIPRRFIHSKELFWAHSFSCQIKLRIIIHQTWAILTMNFPLNSMLNFCRCDIINKTRWVAGTPTTEVTPVTTW